MSSGQASESGCYEATNAAYHYLTEILHVHPAQIVVSGWSLCAAVAIDLAARKQVAGLIALSAQPILTAPSPTIDGIDRLIRRMVGATLAVALALIQASFGPGRSESGNGCPCALRISKRRIFVDSLVRMLVNEPVQP